MASKKILDLLGDKASFLLDHKPVLDKSTLSAVPSPNHVEEIWINSGRSNHVLRSLQTLISHGRLSDTGYLSIFPVDQGVEHSGGASFAPNPIYFDPENIIKLAMRGGCNAVTSTFGVLGAVARKYAHKIPFIVKLNHNEFLTYPNKFDQIMFGRVEQAADMGAVAVGATIYFGSDESGRQIVEVAEAFQAAHEMGLATILCCYLRNPDIIKQKLPENNGGYNAISSKENPYGKIDKRVYTELTTDNLIDLCRYQVANCYMGRAGLINSGGASGENDFQEAIKTAVINKRAGGMGLISGRKAFQRPFAEGAKLLQTIQDVYLAPEVTVAQAL